LYDPREVRRKDNTKKKNSISLNKIHLKKSIACAHVIDIFISL